MAKTQDAEPVAPSLTAEQKYAVALAVKDLEIAQLRAHVAQTALQQIVASVTPAGYQLTDKLELVKVP